MNYKRFRMIGNYKEHAQIWDWDGYDDWENNEFWCKWAEIYGKNILIPMCALGKRGAYMAERGFNVTAFDITEEMVTEGNIRYGGIKNLNIIYGDIRNFNFNINTIDFTYIIDLCHLLNISDIQKAFDSINKHLRKNGCMVIEIGLPTKEPYDWSNETYHPKKPTYKDKKIWKTGNGYYDPNTKRTFISQKVFIENDKGIKSFDHEFYLQLYEYEEIVKTLIECKFQIKNEYCDHNFTKFNNGNFIIIEAIKI